MTQQKPKAEVASIDPLDFEDLICHCFDLDEDEDVGEFLELRVQADGADTLCLDLVQRLLPMVHVSVSPLTGNKYQAFCKTEGGHLVAFFKRLIA